MKRLAAFLAALTMLVIASPANASQLWLAGDIGDETTTANSCAVANNVINLGTPTWVVPLGDLAYPNGSLGDFNSNYNPCWGQYGKAGVPGPVKSVPGNHEYLDSTPPAFTAQGYRSYFGLPATGPLYYNWTAGGWNFIVLDTDDPAGINGGATPSPQYTWLKNTLTANTQGCIAVFQHRARWSSAASVGNYGPDGAMWTLLYNKGVDLVVNGHAHVYERFDRMDNLGARVPITTTDKGVRQITVGTGGDNLGTFTGGTLQPASDSRIEGNYGALKLTTSPGLYTFKYFTTMNPSGPPADTLANVMCNQ